MDNKQLKQKANELWYFFENNIFINDGKFSYNTNLVFAFADYVEELANIDLLEFLQSEDEQDSVKFRKKYSKSFADIKKARIFAVPIQKRWW